MSAKFKDWSNRGRDDLEAIIDQQTANANASAHLHGEGCAACNSLPQETQGRSRNHRCLESDRCPQNR